MKQLGKIALALAFGLLAIAAVKPWIVRAQFTSNPAYSAVVSHVTTTSSDSVTIPGSPQGTKLTAIAVTCLTADNTEAQYTVTINGNGEGGGIDTEPPQSFSYALTPANRLPITAIGTSNKTMTWNTIAATWNVDMAIPPGGSITITTQTPNANIDGMTLTATLNGWKLADLRRQ